MTKRVTNTDIANKLDSVDQRLGKVEDKMQVFHDFMIVQKDRQGTARKPNGSIDWQKLLEKGLTFLVVTASVIYALVEFVVKRAGQ